MNRAPTHDENERPLPRRRTSALRKSDGRQWVDGGSSSLLESNRALSIVRMPFRQLMGTCDEHHLVLDLHSVAQIPEVLLRAGGSVSLASGPVAWHSLHFTSRIFPPSA